MVQGVQENFIEKSRVSKFKLQRIEQESGNVNDVCLHAVQRSFPDGCDHAGVTKANGGGSTNEKLMGRIKFKGNGRQEKKCGNQQKYF